ncbi:hypothetical protein [Fretibacterium sp. OH1220_COT-178]|uniref:hypothetical protein n=1 Tax=Fretibacterium sp. OH1220_COT-178 TaxID=2491047 RepID=UPI000F5F8208|nr:hypothetical protein [Fretibacterium sp. OH1220_COT-178]RRD64367.1 hypothetical protein EII26_07650 [Fretibacterium sp. OH1220_COT-178]
MTDSWKGKVWRMLGAIALFALAVGTLPGELWAAEQPLEINGSSYIDRESDAVVVNGHVFSYDVMSGATVLPSRTAGKAPMDQAEKDRKMFWTIQPPRGIIRGEYYHTSRLFNVGKDGGLGYTAMIDLVIDKGRIVHVEMDESTPSNYYSDLWRAQRKRTSGYGFFQASKGRTDRTLVTLNNGLTFLEWQILKANSLNIDFDTVYGSSNSARDGFIPAVKELLEKIKEPSGRYYIGIAEPGEDGVTPRLELIFEGKKIVEARYNEILADRPEAIRDGGLKKYFRQSRRDSVYYRADTKGSFNAFVDKLTAAILEKQSLDVSVEPGSPEAGNYARLAAKIQPVVDEYLAQGYTHDIGKIAEKPENWTPKGGAGDAHLNDLLLEVVPGSAGYDPAKGTYSVALTATNKGEGNYVVHMESFFLNVKTPENAWDTVGGGDSSVITLAPGEVRELRLNFSPVLKTDTQVSVKYLKYAGVDKLYFTFDLPNP